MNASSNRNARRARSGIARRNGAPVRALASLFSSLVLALGTGLIPFYASAQASVSAASCRDVFKNSDKSTLAPSRSPRPSVVQILAQILPQPADRRYFESCGANCWQGNAELERRFPIAPRLRLEISAQAGSVLRLDTGGDAGGDARAVRELHMHPRDLADPQKVASYLTQWLVSHPLHPFSDSPAYGAKPFRFKQGQADALAAIAAAEQRGEPSLLVVGTGGVGKTPIILKHLENQLLQARQQSLANSGANNSQKGFHLVLGNTRLHLNQLVAQIEKHFQEKLDLKLIAWGDNFGSVSFAELIKSLDNEERPVVLVSTIASFRNRFYENPSANAEQLRSRLLSLSMDEVHHAGARLMRPIVKTLTADRPQFFTLGTTAVPVHREISIQAMFGYRSFWLNLDGREDTDRPPADRREYNASNQTRSTRQDMRQETQQDVQPERSIGEVISQYENTVQSGEITPLENLYFITPESLGLTRDDLFITPGEAKAGRRILNPAAYPQVFGLLAPLYLEGGQSITMTGSIASADAVTTYLQSHFPQHTFAVIHSKTERREETLDAFKRQKIDHVIAVEMLDEAFDLPELTTLIDLTPSASARQIIQRFARPSRLADGKSEVSVALFLGATENYLAEQIELLDRLMESRANAAQSGDILPRVKTQPTLAVSRIAPHF